MDVVSQLAATLLMAWFCIVLVWTDLAVASPVLLVAIFGLTDVVSRPLAAILMALWFCIILLRTNLAIASPVVVVAILARSIACLGSDFYD